VLKNDGLIICYMPIIVTRPNQKSSFKKHTY